MVFVNCTVFCDLQYVVLCQLTEGVRCQVEVYVTFHRTSAGRVGLPGQEMGLLWEGRTGVHGGVRTGFLENGDTNFL